MLRGRSLRNIAATAGVALALPATGVFASSHTSAIVKRTIRSVGRVSTYDNNGNGLSEGSCFIVTPDGAIVTNHHVIAGARSATIKFPSGRVYEVEGVLALDERHDLVLLKIAGQHQPALLIEQADSAEIGDDVIAIGSPFGWEATVSKGIVSGFRTAEDGDGYVIQTTAPVSPGSSGGPLINGDGHVIGVTAGQIAGAQNLNFAIPAFRIRDLLAAASATVAPLTSTWPVNVGDYITSTEMRTRYGAPFAYFVTRSPTGALVETFTYQNIRIETVNAVVVSVSPSE